MSPFSHLLYELRMRHGVRQVELAERVGYDQTYISALEVGLKGPPTQEFVGRLARAMSLSTAEIQAVEAAVEASQRKYIIDVDAPRDVYSLASNFHTKLPTLTPTQVRLIQGVLDLAEHQSEPWTEPPRRPRRRRNEEATM